MRRPIGRLLFNHAAEIEHLQTALRRGDFKLIYYWDTRERFLYDLADDLGESRGLAAEKPELVARLLDEFKAHVRAGLGEQAFAALERGEATQRPRANR